MTYYQLMKKQCSSAGWALLIYYGILSTFITISMMIAIFADGFPGDFLPGGGFSDGEILAADYDAMQNAWGYIIAIPFCAVLAFIWKKKKFTFDIVFHKGKPMTLGSFCLLFCIATSSQLVFSLLTTAVEALLNQFGLSAIPSAETASMTAESFSMFLYAGIIAPIFEEFFFRGVILRHIQPYGKRLAIFASAFLFGMYHGNIVQSPFAFCIGLVYGYIAINYNILWAMLLHMINNLVLGDMFSRLSPLVGEAAMNMIYALVIYGSVIVAIVTLIACRKKIGAYFRENRMAKGSIKACLLAPGVMVFSALMIINMISMLFMEY